MQFIGRLSRSGMQALIARNFELVAALKNLPD